MSVFQQFWRILTLHSLNIDSFPFFLIAPFGTPVRRMVDNSGESGHPCLIPDLRGNAFNFSPLRMMFAVGLSYMADRKSTRLNSSHT